MIHSIYHQFYNKKKDGGILRFQNQNINITMENCNCENNQANVVQINEKLAFFNFI